MIRSSGKWRGACRLACAAGIFIYALSVSPPAEAEEEGAPVTSPEVVPGPDTGSIFDRLKVTLGGGLFLPMGPWSDGFDPGIALGIGCDFPSYPILDLGARLSRIETRRDDHAAVDWLSIEAQATYYPPLESTVFDPFLVGRGGLMRAAVEVGQGREEEWDAVAGLGGGLNFPLSDRTDFRVEAVWEKILAEGGGLLTGVELRFGLP